MLCIALLLKVPAYAGGQQFSFSGQAVSEDVQVHADLAYSRERGYGFEPTSQRNAAGQPYFFSVNLAEGNYRVTARLGGADASDTTIKAELRRLMLNSVKLPAGSSVERTFIVNVKTAKIPATDGLRGGAVLLKAPRETVEEAWAWDNKLTLEINGPQPALQRLTIEPVRVPTLFLLGDSTVADQSQEPYSSWGQMLAALFKPTLAIANHAESGESYRDSISRRRLDKVLSALQAGDTVLMQFGHNDQKQQKDGSGSAASYQAEIKMHVELIRARGGLPVIVSPMERRGFDEQGHIKPSLLEYAEAARQVASTMQAPFIDLNTKSKLFYESLGPERSKLAFAEPAPGKIDNTHHNNYGSYQLARLVALGLRQAGVPVAEHLRDDLGVITPTQPQPPESFRVVPSPGFTHQRPLGDEDR